MYLSSPQVLALVLRMATRLPEGLLEPEERLANMRRRER